LSRDIASDLANSPPDLGHRFETFGKATGEAKFDTFSGKTAITKSADNLDKPKERSKFDTFSGTVDDHAVRPELPAKKAPKAKPKRKPLSVDTYELRPSFESQATLPLRDSSPREPNQKESFRDTLHPAIFQIDQSKAVLRDKLHEELREKYGVNHRAQSKTKPPKVPSITHRPPLRTQSLNPNDSYLKVQSNDALNARPVPSPRTSKTTKFADDDDEQDPTYATIQPRNKSPRLPPHQPQQQQPHPQQHMHSNVPLGRLSKEDLLDLSQKSESEIHEFLNGGNRPKPRMDPP
jgi:hypothetical protein